MHYYECAKEYVVHLGLTGVTSSPRQLVRNKEQGTRDKRIDAKNFFCNAVPSLKKFVSLYPAQKKSASGKLTDYFVRRVENFQPLKPNCLALTKST